MNFSGRQCLRSYYIMSKQFQSHSRILDSKKSHAKIFAGRVCYYKLGCVCVFSFQLVNIDH